MTKPDLLSEDLGAVGTITGPSSPDSNGQKDVSTSADAPEEYRTLAELNDLASSGSSSLKLNDTEKKRASIAVQRGLGSDEEIDEILNGQKEDKDTSVKTEVKDRVPVEDNTDDNVIDTSTQSEEDTELGQSEPAGDDNIDSQLLNALGPHLKNAESIDDAVQAIKDLEYGANRKGEFVNKAEKLGIKNIQELEQTVSTLNNIDKTIAERLQSPQGLQSLYKDFGMQMPAGVMNGTAPVNNGQQAQENPVNNGGEMPQELNQYLENIEQDGFIGAGDFKNLIPMLANSIQKNLETKYQEQNSRFDKVGQYVNGLAQKSAREQAVQTTFQEAREISSKFSSFDEGLVLSEDPSIIWKESVNSKNQVQSNTHPEWPKLQHILTIRKMAIDEERAMYKEKGITNMQPDVMAVLSKRFINNGQLSKIQKNAGKIAKSNLVSQLASKLQPSLHGKRSSSNESFKTPKSSSDVKNMSKGQRKQFFNKLKRGDIRVGL